MDNQINPRFRLILGATLLLSILLALGARPAAAAEATYPLNSQLAAPECNPSNGSGGLPPGRYQTTVAGLNAVVVVPQSYNPSRPAYLAFWIHGDGGAYQRYKKAGNPVTQFVEQHGWILFSPQSPNGGESWWRNWSGNHNDALAAAFNKMFSKYNVCRNVMFGSSGSGGSEFWTAYFFPAKGGQYPAHMVIGCGGNDGHDSTSRNQVMALGRDPSVVARSTFYFVYGTEDRLVPGILDAIRLYRSAGFRVEVTAIQGAGHCNKWPDQGFPSLQDRIISGWRNMANRLGVP